VSGVFGLQPHDLNRLERLHEHPEVAIYGKHPIDTGKSGNHFGAGPQRKRRGRRLKDGDPQESPRRFQPGQAPRVRGLQNIESAGD
jgi:hypothetical protein